MRAETASTPRARARAQLELDIIRVGREHLAAHGAAALSLRAIARDLGMVSSAVYRYVRSRDELLTLLVVDAYDESADRVDAALAATPADAGVHARIRAAAHALRAWAVSEPSRYALIYGSPVPGYTAPGEQTTGPGTRFVASLLRELRDVVVDELPPTPGGLATEFDAVNGEFGLELDHATLTIGTCLWSVILGSISLEVFGQYGADTFAQPEVLFDLQLTTVLSRLLP
ncbi:TetR/AcrR family transcriptional regulator [Williamsia phyllosphaerae]|uniref:TetR family transcriptional regulator n=1 Tax=Williamsia phyllosphaerae TaxID=885042 RepID=A0ABQ1UZX5_9NOCA|nr:TetR-like C-terminal domain-containing protein [Williamsia phyllosphaerae]GGF29622.1 TetR family transcriptional regulator [Williamsia phyllosphaerae]